MEFDRAILQIADKAKRTLQFIDDDIKEKCEEIRIRQNLPICLTIAGKVAFVCENSRVCYTLPQNPIIATKEMLEETLASLCNNSVYMHENEIKQGFISIKNGGRAGVCGVFNADGMLIGVSSINIRIARQIYDCAQILLPYVMGGLLIAGPPGSGKTTILRDLIRLISNGESGDYKRVSVIDSRQEISGGGAMDIGVNTDTVCTLDKSKGVQIALRTMSPNFIAFDEIGTVEELNSVSDCFNAGVDIITTAHCKDEKDLLYRKVTHNIIKNGIVKNVALLSSERCENIEILSSAEIVRRVYG